MATKHQQPNTEQDFRNWQARKAQEKLRAKDNSDDLLWALKTAYRSYVCVDGEISFKEAADRMRKTLIEVMGDEEFHAVFGG